jgi:hypothetical protein
MSPYFRLSPYFRPAKNVLGKNPLLSLLSWGLGSISFHRKEAKGEKPGRSEDRAHRAALHGQITL